MASLEPLGIDIGAARVRVAVAQRAGDCLRIEAVAARDLPPSENDVERSGDFEAILLEEMLEELGVRQRACVFALGAPDATLRAAAFPAQMGYWERRAAARFESLHDESGDETSVVRVHAIDRPSHAFVIAAAKEGPLRSRLRAMKKAGLRVVAVDHDACALARVMPGFQAIVDVGLRRARLHVFTTAVPQSLTALAGGVSVTQAIAEDLGVETEIAERRKRILGAAGASSALAACANAIVDLIKKARLAPPRCSAIAMIGNGARLPGLADEIAARSGMEVRIPVVDLLRTSPIAHDVLRLAAPDWTLAAALATWRAA
ncbi:MAG: pilus assembly protein PilM [Candidatus Tyrphobacter sp.]